MPDRLSGLSAQGGNGHIVGGDPVHLDRRGRLHASAGNVAWTEGALIGLPAVAGAYAGAAVHQRLDSRRVVLLFALFLAVSRSGWRCDPRPDRGAARPAGGDARRRCSASAAGSIFVPTLIFLGRNDHVAWPPSWRQCAGDPDGLWRRDPLRRGALQDSIVIGLASVPPPRWVRPIANSLSSRTLQRSFAVLLLRCR